MAKRTSLFCSGALFFASALAQPYHTDGGPSWIGTGWIGGGFSSPSADSAPGPSSSVTNPSIGSGGTPPTRLPGKLGGYGYGGGGGPCEAGCDWRPKPVATTTSSASDLAAAKAKRREVNLETYIAAAAAIYRVNSQGTQGPYAALRGALHRLQHGIEALWPVPQYRPCPTEGGIVHH